MASLVQKSGLEPFLSSTWVQHAIHTCDALELELETGTLLSMLGMKPDDVPRVEFDFSL